VALFPASIELPRLLLVLALFDEVERVLAVVHDHVFHVSQLCSLTEVAFSSGNLDVEQLLAHAKGEVDHLPACLAHSVHWVLAHQVHAVLRSLPLVAKWRASVFHVYASIQVCEIQALHQSSSEIVNDVDC